MDAGRPEAIMLQVFPIILFRTSLRFYPFILLSLPIILQLFPGKIIKKTHDKSMTLTIL